jgi:hypothetical protein
MKIYLWAAACLLAIATLSTIIAIDAYELIRNSPVHCDVEFAQ